MSERNLLVVQSGGPTQVLNATLAAIIEEAHGRFARVLGVRWGVKGVARGEIVDLGRLSEAEIALLRVSPGAVLGSSRAKPTEDDLLQFVDRLRCLEIHDLLFLGGNGTMRGAEIVHRFCKNLEYDLQVLGVPKTVDNDLAVTDRCPGDVPERFDRLVYKAMPHRVSLYFGHHAEAFRRFARVLNLEWCV